MGQGLKYKMLVTDMDYTLLNKNKEVSKRNRAAIKSAIEKGVMVVVATGRIYTSARVYARLLGVTTPIIASNGAIIRDEGNDKVLYQSVLPEAAAYKMIDLCKEQDLHCHLYTRDTIFAEKLVNISLRYSEWNEYLKEEDRVKIEIVPSLEAVVSLEKENILKAVVIAEESYKIDYIKEEILKTGIATASRSLKDNIEVMSKEVSKGNAVRFLSDLYGIERTEIMTIGDNENDISMIEYAGLGVAVSNAHQSLLEVADYVTGDFNEDGVAQAIEKFLL